MAFVVDSRVIFKGEISCQSVLRDNMKGKRFSVSGAEIPQILLGWYFVLLRISFKN